MKKKHALPILILMLLTACAAVPDMKNSLSSESMLSSQSSITSSESISKSDDSKVFQFSEIPDINIKDVVIEKIEYIDKSMGEAVVFTDFSKIEKISMVLSKLEIHNIITTDKPKDSDLGSCYLLKCYELKSDENPSYTIYLDPFIIETQKEIFGPYRVDNLKDILNKIIAITLELRE